MPRAKRSARAENDLQAEDILFRPKLQLKIKELKWTAKQKQFFKSVFDENTRIMFLSGPAGTSKTLLAVYCGLKMLNEGKVSEIMYLRSAVESSEAKLGFLPGSAEEKLNFYNFPFIDKIEELVENATPNRLVTENKIQMFPINYARGLNWSQKFIILDEAQNSTKKELTTVLTRLSTGSKCFVLGDPMQTDLRINGGYLEKMMELFSDEESAKAGVKAFSFDEDDIMRDELVKFLVKKLKALD